MFRPARIGPDDVASVDEIRGFLQQVRAEVASPGRFNLVPRKKNLDDIARLGFTMSVVKDEILGLTYRDYDRGPLVDDSGEGEIWEFIKTVDGVQIYIKLKTDNSRGCVCISFHESNGPYRLPYRK
ncbi:MAG: hypothetical protein HPY52_15925 [Firmicutes bacterium]|nr:hypothetical protein [Bacillota bacterium]